jgi:hypothetical protein
MTSKPASNKSVIQRVRCYCAAASATSPHSARDFSENEKVRATAQVKNDGTYPHKELGEVIVQDGDIGFVRESWHFLGRIYYTVEFTSRGVVVIMRERELIAAES